jgi:hypothetical protein
MYADSYFPKPQVDKVKDILLGLCRRIEEEKPSTVDHFLRLTHEATERINGLAEEFEEHDSELETGAREAMAADFGFIAEAYGFGSIDIEEIIAPRDW